MISTIIHLLVIIGSLSIYSSTYTDLTDDNSSTTLAVVECNTRGSLPNSVTWQRNGVKIDLDNAKYEMIQTMTNRRYSHYQYKLIVRDVFGALGNLTYSCMVTNFYGTDSRSVYFTKAGKHLYILVKLSLHQFHSQCSCRDHCIFRTFLWRLSFTNVQNLRLASWPTEHEQYRCTY